LKGSVEDAAGNTGVLGRDREDKGDVGAVGSSEGKEVSIRETLEHD
jgi:hypothetical protein